MSWVIQAHFFESFLEPELVEVLTVVADHLSHSIRLAFLGGHLDGGPAPEPTSERLVRIPRIQGLSGPDLRVIVIEFESLEISQGRIKVDLLLEGVEFFEGREFHSYGC
jgi:hypothetical protein